MMDAQDLKAELDQALADLEEAGHLEDINQTLVDMLDLMKARKSVAPQVNVNVNPTPITVQVPPTRQLVRIDHEYDGKGRIVRSVPVYKGA